MFNSVARYGGEEFVVVMPGVSLEEQFRRPRRLRAAIEDTVFSWEAGMRNRLTVSIGVACNGAESPEALLHAADLALYAAKRAGRNRVQDRTS